MSEEKERANILKESESNAEERKESGSYCHRKERNVAKDKQT